MLIEGKPWPLEYWARLFVDGIAFNDVQFSQGRRCESEIWLSNETVAHCLNPISDDDRWPVEFSEFTLNAFRAARAARFEHGETPNQTLQVRFEDR